MKIAVFAGQLISFALLMSSTDGFAWGRKGHEVINHAAIELMESPLKDLFLAHKKELKGLANVPDNHWKNPNQGGQLEKKAHFFQWDQYSEHLDAHMPIPLAKAVDITSCEVVFENGTAVWRSHQLHTLMVEALRQRDLKRAIQVAGTLGHYIADMSQPMHVTSDYDGQSINQRGIHAYFETELLNSYNENDLLAGILKEADAQRRLAPSASDLPIVKLVFEEGKRALARLPHVLDIFSADGKRNDDALFVMANEAMAEGAVALAAAWDRAAEEAGYTVSEDTKVNPGKPSWIAYELAGEEDSPSGCVRR